MTVLLRSAPLDASPADQTPRVAVVMGSDSDLPTMQPAVEMLQRFRVACEVRVLSAHRTPREMVAFAEAAAGRGFKVIIAGAGGAAHLPGMVASLTTLPVIGVPVQTRALSGVDSLHSIVQMPAGIPAGICTIECSESTPERARVCTGTPITGRVVSEATIPGRWAAPPAPAMITLKPRPAAASAKATISRGVRWAESTRTSQATLKRWSISTAGCMVGRSESLPITTATRGV